MLISPEDREPRSEENLADRLRGAGVAWTDQEVADAHKRLTAVFGGDVRAAGAAAAALMALATRRPRPVDRLGDYLAALTDDQLRKGRPVERPKRARPEPKPLGCAVCTAGPTPVGFVGEDDAGRYVPCRTCKPHLVRGAA